MVAGAHTLFARRDFSRAPNPASAADPARPSRFSARADRRAPHRHGRVGRFLRRRGRPVRRRRARDARLAPMVSPHERRHGTPPNPAFAILGDRAFLQSFRAQRGGRALADLARHDRFGRAHVPDRRTARRLLARLCCGSHPCLFCRRISARANGYPGRDFLALSRGRDLLPGPRLSTPEVLPGLVRRLLDGRRSRQPDERSRRSSFISP